NVLVINSTACFDENVQYEQGINIIVGGNSLGRGVTFPMLQTIYYCRVAKNPQADTMWQHARMFGYDRDADLMRIFMPSILYKLFSDINKTNNNIVAQIQKYGAKNVKICYPAGLKPTRNNVLDQKALGIYTGGVNYFPFYAANKSIDAIDGLLDPFADGEYIVNLNVVINILLQCSSEADDWNGDVFAGFVKSIIAENPIAQGYLIVRRGRDIGRGTGTLLAPIDRKLGESANDVVVLTVYKITGNKGWNGQKIWIPNIKFPGDNVYYSV
ncbi:MAG: Z1 domain-containing protein, partial [Carnobacterium sp.]